MVVVVGQLWVMLPQHHAPFVVFFRFLKKLNAQPPQLPLLLQTEPELVVPTQQEEDGEELLCPPRHGQHLQTLRHSNNNNYNRSNNNNNNNDLKQYPLLLLPL